MLFAFFFFCVYLFFKGGVVCSFTDCWYSPTSPMGPLVTRSHEGVVPCVCMCLYPKSLRTMFQC